MPTANFTECQDARVGRRAYQENGTDKYGGVVDADHRGRRGLMGRGTKGVLAASTAAVAAGCMATLAALAVVGGGAGGKRAAVAQQRAFSKVEIEVTPVAGKVYML